MRYLILLLALLFLFSCGNDGGNSSSSSSSSSDSNTQALKPSDPPAAPPLPANLSVPDLRNEVRNVLRMQLPLTYPEQRNGQLVKKGYSFDVEAYDNGQPLWVVAEKLYNPVNDELLTGGKYLMLWANVDPSSFGYVYSQNDERIGLVVRAKKGQSFVFHPYAQELRDEVVTEVVIGWYDRVQDATLSRGLVALQTLAANMGKWEAE